MAPCRDTLGKCVARLFASRDFFRLSEMPSGEGRISPSGRSGWAASTSRLRFGVGRLRR